MWAQPVLARRYSPPAADTAADNMAPPAPPAPNIERYSAGSCVLDIEARLSALSQWSARPIADQLKFQLWLHSSELIQNELIQNERLEENENARLLAEGDHADLGELIQYFQYQTQQVLAIAHLNRQPTNTPYPARPSSLQLTTPLSYLQLADITAVLDQYEQAARVLPLALSNPVEQAGTNSSRADNAPLAEANRNVVSLAAAREASRARRPNQTQSATQAHRQRRNRLWMSSAAAALFAVGLSSTLWLRDSSLRQMSTTSESAAPSDQAEDSIQANGARPPTAPPETTPPESDSVQSEQQDTAASESEPTNRSEAETQAPTAATDQDFAQTNPDTAQTVNPAQRRPPAPVAASPAPGAEAPPTASSDAADAEKRPAAQPAPPAPAAPPANNQTAAPPTTSARTAREPDTAAPEVETATAETADTETADEGTANEANAPSQVLSGARPPAAPSAEATIETAREAARETRPPNEPAQTRAPEGITAPRDIPQIEPPQPEAPQPEAPEQEAIEQEAAEGATEQATADIPAESPEIAQVRTYFQQRWQPNESAQLTYRLRLSPTGEVLLFEGLDTVSQQARDRILPTSTPPTFNLNTSSPNSSADPIELRIRLLPDGRVQVWSP